MYIYGRIYDYNLGRFMSVDPFIQMPQSSQSINPYSYIMNNPMAGTDPTGYLAEVSESTEAQVATDTQKAQEANVTEEREVNHFGGRIKSRVSVVVGTATITNGAVTSVRNLNGKTIANTTGTPEIGKPADTAERGKSQYTFMDDIKNDVKKQIHSDAMEITGQRPGANAKWVGSEIDDSGIITQATIYCNRTCQYEANEILLGRDVARADLGLTLMRANMRSAQNQAMFAVGVGFLFTGVPVVFIEAAPVVASVSSKKTMQALLLSSTLHSEVVIFTTAMKGLAQTNRFGSSAEVIISQSHKFLVKPNLPAQKLRTRVNRKTNKPIAN